MATEDAVSFKATPTGGVITSAFRNNTINNNTASLKNEPVNGLMMQSITPDISLLLWLHTVPNPSGTAFDTLGGISKISDSHIFSRDVLSGHV